MLIRPRTLKFIFLDPFARLIPITEPTTACELETGTSGKEGNPFETRKCFKPCEAKRNRTIELAKTTTKAVIGDSLKILEPTVSITFFEYVKTPIAMAIPPKRNNCCTEDNWIKFPI